MATQVGKKLLGLDLDGPDEDGEQTLPGALLPVTPHTSSHGGISEERFASCYCFHIHRREKSFTIERNNTITNIITNTQI